MERSKGFTLIELLIAIAIIGLIMTLAVGQLNKFTKRELRHQAARLSSTIRFLYNKAISDGLTLRLVIDMEEEKYWVEGAEGSVALKREEGLGTMDYGLLTKDKERKKEEKKTKSPESRVLSPESSKAGPSFTPESSYLLKSVTLPKGVYFKDVFAEHQAGPLSEGKAYVYFFPQGYAERAVINLRDKNDEAHFSLAINPVSGAVAVENKYKEMEGEK